MNMEEGGSEVEGKLERKGVSRLLCCFWKLLCNWLALLPITPIASSSLLNSNCEIESRDEGAANGKKKGYRSQSSCGVLCPCPTGKGVSCGGAFPSRQWAGAGEAAEPMSARR